MYTGKLRVKNLSHLIDSPEAAYLCHHTHNVHPNQGKLACGSAPSVLARTRKGQEGITRPGIACQAIPTAYPGRWVFYCTGKGPQVSRGFLHDTSAILSPILSALLESLPKVIVGQYSLPRSGEDAVEQRAES